MMTFHGIQAVLHSLAQAEIWCEWVFVRPSSIKSRNCALSELRVKYLIYFMHLLAKIIEEKYRFVFGAHRVQGCFVASVSKWVVRVVQRRWSL